MQVQLDWKYKFSFIPPYDVFNKVYSVVKSYTYKEAVSDNINMYTELYSKVAMLEIEYERDIVPALRTCTIYKLVNVKDDKDMIYIPDNIISLEPDSNVKKYYNSVVTWNIGVHEDQTQLSNINSTISQLIEKMTGTEATPIIIDIGVTWLTDNEYTEINNARTLKQQEAINYFSENQKLRQENTSLKLKCVELEKIILHLKNQTP